VRGTLGWQPQFDDLAVIVAHALDWKAKLSTHRTAAAKGTDPC